MGSTTNSPTLLPTYKIEGDESAFSSMDATESKALIGALSIFCVVACGFIVLRLKPRYTGEKSMGRLPFVDVEKPKTPKTSTNGVFSPVGKMLEGIWQSSEEILKQDDRSITLERSVSLKGEHDEEEGDVTGLKREPSTLRSILSDITEYTDPGLYDEKRTPKSAKMLNKMWDETNDEVEGELDSLNDTAAFFGLQSPRYDEILQNETVVEIEEPEKEKEGNVETKWNAEDISIDISIHESKVENKIEGSLSPLSVKEEENDSKPNKKPKNPYFH